MHHAEQSYLDISCGSFRKFWFRLDWNSTTPKNKEGTATEFDRHAKPCASRRKPVVQSFGAASHIARKCSDGDYAAFSLRLVHVHFLAHPAEIFTGNFSFLHLFDLGEIRDANTRRCNVRVDRLRDAGLVDPGAHGSRGVHAPSIHPKVIRAGYRVPAFD
jgi:hypothetical protein